MSSGGGGGGTSPLLLKPLVLRACWLTTPVVTGPLFCVAFLYRSPNAPRLAPLITLGAAVKVDLTAALEGTAPLVLLDAGEEEKEVEEDEAVVAVCLTGETCDTAEEAGLRGDVVVVGLVEAPPAGGGPAIPAGGLKLGLSAVS